MTMPGTLIKLTAAGRAALVGPDNTGTVSRQVASVGIANAPFVHSDALTVLPNEHKRIDTIAGRNVAPDTIHVTIRDDSADQFTAYGFGLYLDNGALLGTYSQDTPILEKSPAAIFLLSTDMQFVSIDAALLTFGDASFFNPPASTETQGVIEIATQAEADAGVDTQRAITPKTLATRLSMFAPLTSPGLLGIPTAPTPPAGDSSTKIATTAFVLSTIKDALVGQIVLEIRNTARAGFLKCNGALLNRADYPALWAYAQASGALVTEAQWSANNWGRFSSGDGATTFRIPELRGEFPRFWDDGRGADGSRGIGSYQSFQNCWHSHGASSSSVGDHAHSAWTDAQGWHGHSVGDPGHAHGVQTYTGGGGTGGGRISGSYVAWGDAVGGTNGSGTGIWINGDGSHAHNVGIGGAGSHSHSITVNGDGGAEVRVRNVSLLAMIRAF